MPHFWLLLVRLTSALQLKASQYLDIVLDIGPSVKRVLYSGISNGPGHIVPDADRTVASAGINKSSLVILEPNDGFGPSRTSLNFS